MDAFIQDIAANTVGGVITALILFGASRLLQRETRPAASSAESDVAPFASLRVPEVSGSWFFRYLIRWPLIIVTTLGMMFLGAVTSFMLWFSLFGSLQVSGSSIDGDTAGPIAIGLSAMSALAVLVYATAAVRANRIIVATLFVFLLAVLSLAIIYILSEVLSLRFNAESPQVVIAAAPLALLIYVGALRLLYLRFIRRR